jgi:hypothetical protein
MMKEAPIQPRKPDRGNPTAKPDGPKTHHQCDKSECDCVCVLCCCVLCVLCVCFCADRFDFGVCVRSLNIVEPILSTFYPGTTAQEASRNHRPLISVLR